MENKKYYTKKLVSEHEFSEVDFDLSEFLYKDNFLVEKIELIYGNLDNHPIEIDKLVFKLQEMKKEGANFVAIDYNGDHISYVLEGYEIKCATEEEVSKYEEHLNDWLKVNKDKRIKELEDELKKLKSL